MKFTIEEIKDRLKRLEGWAYDEQGDRIWREFKFKIFVRRWRLF
jgi:pterin-4a-carbinolamine dehydratase